MKNRFRGQGAQSARPVYKLICLGQRQAPWASIFADSDIDLYFSIGTIPWRIVLLFRVSMGLKNVKEIKSMLVVLNTYPMKQN